MLILRTQRSIGCTRWIFMVPSGAVSLGSPTTCIAPSARVSTSADSSVSLICQHFCCHYVLDSLRPKGHSEMSTICPLSGGMCCKTRLLLAIGFGGEFWRCPCPALPSTALTHRYRNLTPRLREANGGHRWRRTAEKLSKPPQVLCSCGEQHFILGAAQATQPKPVELQDALHMSKPHLDLLALAA